MLASTFRKLLVATGAAFLLVSLTPAAQAGPSPQEYAPVRTMKEANSLPVGTRIAISCGNCNGVTLTRVDKERTYLNPYTCPLCMRKFHVQQPGGGGRAVATGSFVYVDERGDKAHLSAAKM